MFHRSISLPFFGYRQNNELNMAVPMLRKFQGSLVGAVIGDCIGGVFEDQNWGTVIGIKQVLKLVKAIEDGNVQTGDDCAKKTKRFYHFTDDTAMARSVAKSLIKHNGLDVNDMARRFTEKFMKERGRGYGGSVVVVFEALAQSGYKDVFGPAKAQFGGEGSFGNGGAMRIAPAGLFAHQKNMSFDELKNLVENITRITHSHVQAIHGAILQAYAVQLALRMPSLDVTTYLDELIVKLKDLEEETANAKDKAEQEHKTDEGTKAEHGSACKEEVKLEEVKQQHRLPYCAKLAEIRDLCQRETLPDPKEIREKLGVYIAALDSVPAAIYCFLRSMKDIEGLEDRHPFERTIIYAISLGGDTDTVATMAGSIAGAYYGLDVIPTSWQHCCEGRKDAEIYAEKIYKLK